MDGPCLKKQIRHGTTVRGAPRASVVDHLSPVGYKGVYFKTMFGWIYWSKSIHMNARPQGFPADHTVKMISAIHFDCWWF